MTWAAILSLIVAFLPVLQELLQSLFPAANASLTNRPTGTPETDITQLFGALRAQTSRWYPWHWRKRAQLDLAERICQNHSAEIGRALQFGGLTPRMTAEEEAEVAMS